VKYENLEKNEQMDWAFSVNGLGLSLWNFEKRKKKYRLDFVKISSSSSSEKIEI
jgi:hypothetical protein